MTDYKIINKCLLCGGSIKEILHLANSPLANEFIYNKDKQDLFPLNLMQCQSCNHIQLDCIVSKERLYRNYFYVSSTSKVNVEHFKTYADLIINEFNLTSKDIICDIASNDGCFLKNFLNQNIKVIGVDPAQNIAKQANDDGVFTIPEFFNKDLAKNISDNYGKAKVITCNNCFAHNEDLDTIVEGVLELLSDDGVFIIENSYLLDILDKGLLDLVYHEHMHHFHIDPLVKYFKKFKLDIFDVERLPNHGGSFRAYMCKAGTREIKQSVYDILNLEKNINTKIDQFCDNVLFLRDKISSRLQQIYNSGKSIAIYGLPAKFTTLAYTFNIDENIIKYGIEDALLKQSNDKQNVYSPGKHIQIFSPDKINTDPVDYIFIGAWNFSDSIIKNNSNFKGTWIIPLPEYKEI